MLTDIPEYETYFPFFSSFYVTIGCHSTHVCVHPRKRDLSELHKMDKGA
jgi:hypothetical protein